MRIGLVIVGIVLAILGGVLLYVPIVPQTSQTVQSSSDTPYFLGSISGYSLTGTIAVSVTWTATSTVDVAAAACTSSCATTNSTSGVSDITYQSGTSGSFTLNQPNSGYILMGIFDSSGQAAANATFKITTALSTVGTVLLPVGIVLLIVGIVLRKSGSKSSAPAMSTTTETMDATPPTNPPPSS